MKKENNKKIAKAIIEACRLDPRAEAYAGHGVDKWILGGVTNYLTY